LKIAVIALGVNNFTNDKGANLAGRKPCWAQTLLGANLAGRKPCAPTVNL